MPAKNIHYRINTLLILTILFASYALIMPTLAAASSIPASVPSAPQISAKNYLLWDANSGFVLAEKNIDERINPASITKIMTSYVVAAELASKRIALSDEVLVSEKAYKTGGSRMFIEVNKRVSVDDLLQGLVVQSGNDAAVALAEYVAGSEEAFADRMNLYARELGMTNTNYVNSTGFTADDHYTTARDIATLAKALILNYPEHYKRYAQKEFSYNGIKQNNRNNLLWRDDAIDGIKTGHTEAAGYCLAASAKKNGMRLISVVLGTDSANARINQSQTLLNYGFRFFRTERIYAAGETVQEARIWMGREQTLPLGVADDLFVTLPRDAFEDLTSQIELSEYIRAPARIGQEFGRSVLKSGDRVVGEVPLLALRKIDEGGIFQRMKDSVMRHFQ